MLITAHMIDSDNEVVALEIQEGKFLSPDIHDPKAIGRELLFLSDQPGMNDHQSIALQVAGHFMLNIADVFMSTPGRSHVSVGSYDDAESEPTTIIDSSGIEHEVEDESEERSG